MVKLASATTDPDVYATAFYQCQGSKNALCSQISAAQWAKLDPENSVVWLFAADAAMRRNDDDARDAALARFLKVPTSNYRFPPLAPILQSDDVQKRSPLTQQTIGIGLVGIRAAESTFPSYSKVNKYCTLTSTVNDSKRAICDAIANKLVAQDDQVLGKYLGVNIGKKIGWPADRTDSIVAEIKGLQEFQIMESLAPEMFNARNV